jgi:hypothetical protein
MGSTIFVLLFVSTGATAALKGRWLVFFFGLLLGPAVWAVAFLLPATRASWWWEHVYDERRRLHAPTLEPFRRR